MYDEKNLTEKQKIFCYEYVIDWNATRAAIVAGYSENSAQQIGYENLLKPLIIAHIEEIQKDLGKLSGVSALRNVLELKKIAYSNLHNYRQDWMTLKEWETVSIDDKAAIAEVVHITTTSDKGSTTQTVKFKLHDKQRAMEILNKMLGHNQPDKIQIEDLMLTDSDRERRIQALKDKMQE